MYLITVILLFGFYNLPTSAAEPLQRTLKIDHFKSAFALQQFLTNNGENPQIITISASPTTTIEALEQEVISKTGSPVKLSTLRTGMLLRPDITIQELADKYFERDLGLLCNHGFLSYKVQHQ